MTRINCVPPHELTQKHLVAEYRELPRIYKMVAAAVERGELPTDKRNPTAYCLNTGHVRFFYSRLTWITTRYAVLYVHMLERGYKPSFPPRSRLDFPHIPDIWCNDWEPTPEALAINRERIAARLRGN